MLSPVIFRRSLSLAFIFLFTLLAAAAARQFLATAQSQDSPQAKADSYCASPGNELKIPATNGVLNNDTGTPLTIVPSSNPGNGTLKLNNYSVTASDICSAETENAVPSE